MRAKIYELLEGTSEHRLAAQIVSLSIMTLIVLNAAVIVLETVHSIHDSHPLFFHWFDVFSVSVFTVEYLLRIWGCTVDPEYAEPIKGRLKFIFSPMAIIDLLAILPFFLTFIVTDLRFLRTLRLLRILRILKLVRYTHALHTFGKVVRAKREELVIVSVLGMILIFMASSLMYFIEHDAQPDKYSSIPVSMWWAIITVTTVGYGDVFPITYLGKCLNAMVAVFGIGMFALPAGILGSGFVEEFENRRGAFRTCPHCGGVISDRRSGDRRTKPRS